MTFIKSKQLDRVLLIYCRIDRNRAILWHEIVDRSISNVVHFFQLKKMCTPMYVIHKGTKMSYENVHRIENRFRIIYHSRRIPDTVTCDSSFLSPARICFSGDRVISTLLLLLQPPSSPLPRRRSIRARFRRDCSNN